MFLRSKHSAFASLLASLCFTVGLCQSPSARADATANRLTDAERQGGWRLLFDGRTTEGWRGFKKDAFPSEGWVVEDGCLLHKLKARGGDIISKDTFSSFDLTFDWKLAADGNSGVKYFITESRETAIGHEYQIIDDHLNEDAKRGAKRQTAGFYDVWPVNTNKVLHPPGEWNSSRILVKGKHAEHWLNGEKVLEYDMGTDVLRKAIAESKFKDVKGFGEPIDGHILLQDHGGEVYFRNIKIRKLE